MLVLGVVFLLTSSTVSAQSSGGVTIDLNNLVDPLGYPNTTQEYLNVLQFFLQGSKLYSNYTEVPQCVDALKANLERMQYTSNAWLDPLTFGYDWEQDNVYKWPQDRAIYNLTESTS